VGVGALAAALAIGVGFGHLVWKPATPAPTRSGFQFPRFDDPGSSSSGLNPIFGQLPNFSGGSTGSGAAGGAGPSNATSIEAKVDPALVDINSTFNYQDVSGAGTGIVLTSSGEILTNNHVIHGATSISVTDVGNGQTYNATVVGYDNALDVAVLQLQGASGLATATIGNSSFASVGQSVLAIGNAGGVGGTPTAAGGTVSGLNQSVTASDSLDGTSEQLSGLIGTSADVQPGDSGGPLVNGAGKVIGIDTAGSSGSSPFQFSSQSSGSGFAIPINEAIAIAQQIESGNGNATIHVGRTAFLGVLLESAAQGSTSGATIAQAVSGGAASQAGLVAGDVITSFDGHAVSSSTTLGQLLVPLHPGDSVQVTGTTASGQAFSVTAVLQAGPPA
jgi:S1-C subfamily serine protease